MRKTADRIQEAKAAKQQASTGKEPKKPKFRSLHRVAKNVYSKPWLIFQGSEGEITEKNLREALEDDRNIFVELCPMKYKTRLQYEQQEGESIDETITKIVWIMGRTYRLLEAGLTDAERVAIVEELQRDDLGRHKTPLGYLYGSIEYNVAKLCGFILCQKGRIVGKNVDGYILELIEADDLFEEMEGNPFMEINEDKLPVVFEILDAAGLYNMEELKNLEEAEEAQEDGQGNSQKTAPSPAKKGGQKRKPSSTGASKTKKASVEAR